MIELERGGRTLVLHTSETLIIPADTASVRIEIEDLSFKILLSRSSDMSAPWIKVTENQGKSAVLDLQNFNVTLGTVIDHQVGLLNDRPLWLTCVLEPFGASRMQVASENSITMLHYCFFTEVAK